MAVKVKEVRKTQKMHNADIESGRASLIKSLEISSDDLEKINRYTLSELKEEDVFTFKLAACDNDVDRDFEKFSDLALEELANFYKGKTVISNHSCSANDQCARVYDAYVESTGEHNNVGEEYKKLILCCYCVREGNDKLIADIEGGIKKECSVGCAVYKSICSICGADVRRESCTHIKGHVYNGEICYRTLDCVKDAYEVSFVAIPAQPKAGVEKTLKSFGYSDIAKALLKFKFKEREIKNLFL